MKTIIKTTLLTGLFIFALFISVQAQDKYDYAVIEFRPLLKDLQVSINGVEYKTTEAPKEKIKGDADVTVALEEISKMTENGWELFNTNFNTAGANPHYQIFVFYLRKKK